MLTNKLSNFSCCWYHKGTNFQANHNTYFIVVQDVNVVADTTKVRIFKQITTTPRFDLAFDRLLLIPQRYEFSSKSQRVNDLRAAFACCCWYHKGTNFQANHNTSWNLLVLFIVVADTTKVRIFKQITTNSVVAVGNWCCCWYHKGTNFQANHNLLWLPYCEDYVVADTTKVRIFKQITTQGLHNERRYLVVADTTKVRIFKQITTWCPFWY